MLIQFSCFYREQWQVGDEMQQLEFTWHDTIIQQIRFFISTNRKESTALTSVEEIGKVGN